MWLKAPSGNGTKTPLLRSRGSVVSLLLQNRDRKGADSAIGCQAQIRNVLIYRTLHYDLCLLKG